MESMILKEEKYTKNPSLVLLTTFFVQVNHRIRLWSAGEGSEIMLSEKGDLTLEDQEN